MKEQLEQAYQEIKCHIDKELLPFWEKRGVDQTWGGYLVCYDEQGNPREQEDKYIVTQTRMIWAYSYYARKYGKKEYLPLAKQGVEFFIRHFWDEEYGGWYWKTTREGKVLDNGKVVYGQTFAIYALSEYTLASGDAVGLAYAEKTFDLLQKYCADTRYGGYFENLERDWSLAEPGFAAGDLKSLDIHMHTLEAFTTLYECSGKEIHKRKLEEVIHVILDHMVNPEIGCGYNQFDIAFHRKPAINIRRTWNAERETGEVIDSPKDTTSYGHNMELAWLLHRAAEVMGDTSGGYDTICQKLVDHGLKYGFDWERGGVYRDGPHEGEPLVRDKEWWQNCESLVGLLDIYEMTGEEEYFQAFRKNWEFDTTYMICHSVGEWHQLLTEKGEVLVPQMGNPWKAMYHTGRAMLECLLRLEKLAGKEES
ncbi:MAG TPA: AGE family epimerase/isomerase [Candidatus Blautia gallistercoris]|uniref:AGE family epimerase/isomerase n=1 Tax=Candidatus Blautia gallistercoris TaxID=2838490 RepID=A0A9D2B382_9FIRM|nr:AGE family epimerase/isomerase [Candidatus Blautia gallistercoris]